MYSIEYQRAAIRALERMPRTERERVESKIEALARDPFGAANVKALVGQPGYRLRVGDWRVIYDVNAGRLLVRVLRVGARRGVY